ncbi:MAG: S1C family serine protease [Candidatus Aquicultorales bacterium]
MEELRDFFYPEEPDRPQKPDLYVVNHREEPPPKRRLGVFVAVSLISAVIGGLAGGLTLPYLFGTDPISFYRSAQVVGASRDIRIDGKTPVSPVTAVAEKLQPAVVNINTKQGESQKAHGESNGVGSGVVFRADGYILTNLHVVQDASEIWVTVGSDDYKGKVVGSDEETDLAVVKVGRDRLPVAEFGSSKGLKVGDLVVAIGSPFGFEHTVTSGIVSGLRRTVSLPERESSGPRTYTNMIQTDASINPGNSGGALADSSGKVIGINALIMSNSGVNEGVGFAIPVETAVSVAEQLIKGGKATHPYMGIMGQNIEPELVSEYSLPPNSKGALVVEVIAGSPASKAGLKKGDVIMSIDGRRMESMDDLMTEVRQRRVGDRLQIEYLRRSERASCELTLIDKPKD